MKPREGGIDEVPYFNAIGPAKKLHDCPDAGLHLYRSYRQLYMLPEASH